MKIKQVVILVAIIILGAFLRLVDLGKIPAGFTPDEASQAYTAYSILKTGKDEWGNPPFQVTYKSFLDYKAPLQTLLMIPSIALFGLNETAARLPSAIFGIFSIYAVYLLARQLFSSKPHLAIFSALFMALSPMSLQFSRMALEVNLTSALFPLGLYFFLSANNNSKKLALSALMFGLSMYAYHAARIFIPLFGLGLIFLNRKKLLTPKPSHLVVPAIIAVLVSLPIVIDIFSGGSLKRGNDLLITNFDQAKVSLISDSAYYSPLKNLNPILPRIFHNKLTSLATQFTENFTSYLSLPFWFTESGRETTYSVIPGRGLLYYFQLPLVLYGLFLLLTKKEFKSALLLFVLWFVAGVLPAALTKEGYRPNRVGSLLGYFEIVSSLGLVSILALNFPRKKLLGFIFALISFLLVIFYLEDYFVNTKLTFPKSLSYGWRDAISAVSANLSSYDNVVVETGTQSQSFVAFYLSLDPHLFQKHALDYDREAKQKNVNYLDQLDNYKLGKFTFKSLSWPEDNKGKTLFVSQMRQMLPPNRRTLKQVKTPTGEIIIEVFDFSNEK